MRTVGNGDGNWLNGVAWDPAADENLMTEVSPKVYEITYTDLDAFDNYQVKFAANGSWAANWGGIYGGSGVESEAAYNSNDNITIDVPYELADVTLRLDLSNYDHTTKTGATFTVTVVEDHDHVFTVVTLKADYVATLSAGEHTIGIVSTSGTAATTFTVNAKAVVNDDTNPDTGETTSPKTGDHSMMWLWFVLLFVSGTGIVKAAVYSKRKRLNKT